jgi:formylmethanofuran dehydrogenase subunit E
MSNWTLEKDDEDHFVLANNKPLSCGFVHRQIQGFIDADVKYQSRNPAPYKCGKCGELFYHPEEVA